MCLFVTRLSALPLRLSVFSAITSSFLGINFDSWISLKAFSSKVMAKILFAVLALLALRRLRVQSDILDGTGFEAFQAYAPWCFHYNNLHRVYSIDISA